MKVRRGFSLLEILVAVAILAALGAILYPALGHYLLSRGVDGAARQIEADLGRLRSRALQEPGPASAATLPPDQEVVYSYGLEPTFEDGEELPKGWRLYRQQVLHDLSAGTATLQGTPEELEVHELGAGIVLELDPATGARFDHHGRAEADAAISVSGAGVAREIRLTGQSPEIELSVVEAPPGGYGRIDPGGSPTPNPTVSVPGGTITPGASPGP